MAGAARSAIVGLGISRLSRDAVGTTRELAAEAVTAAIDDAGMTAPQIDGLLLNKSPSAPLDALPLDVQADLDLRDLRLLSGVEGEGTSAIQMVQYATLAVQAGMATAVACVFADARVRGASAGAGYRRAMRVTGIADWDERYGLYGAAGAYALAARRYMAARGVSDNALAAFAISCRAWAAGNPLGFLKQPLTLEAYLASRWVVEPLRLLDCAYPVNGAAAVIVTTTERASDSRHPPVFVHGMAQGHGGHPALADDEPELHNGAPIAAQGVYRMAGVGPRDVDICEVYDAFSFMGLQALEDYGLCAPGEAGAFVHGGGTAPGGALPVNTGGGHLSGYYLQGMTPIAEAVIQARGAGGARQVDRRNVILATGVGGRLSYHAALILSPLRRLR